MKIEESLLCRFRDPLLKLIWVFLIYGQSRHQHPIWDTTSSSHHGIRLYKLRLKLIHPIRAHRIHSRSSTHYHWVDSLRVEILREHLEIALRTCWSVPIKLLLHSRCVIFRDALIVISGGYYRPLLFLLLTTLRLLFVACSFTFIICDLYLVSVINLLL